MSGTWFPDDYTPRSWSFTIDFLGRPLVANKAKKMHPIAESKTRAEWRDAAATLARAERIPKGLGAIRVTAQARYRTRRSPSDCDACAPSVKGVIDGLVVAGVIADDKPPFVQQVSYMACEVGTGLPDALIVTVEEAA
jgi:hypothetical protein